MVQPQMAEQQFMIPSSFQTSLTNLPVSIPEDKRIQRWKMDQQILGERGIKIPNENKCFFTTTKQSYFNQVPRLEVWKQKRNTKEAQASKVGLITLLAINQKELDHDALIEFLNIFVIKKCEIYFGRRNIVYVISNQLITYAFGVCQSGYVEHVKGQVTKTL